RALTDMPILAPISGYVVEKDIVAGSAVEPGARLYRLAGLGSVWVEAEVYEQDLGLIEVGQSARIDLPYTAIGSWQGRVAFIYPYLDDTTRTARVRIEVDNPELALKPDMYADVVIEIALGRRLVVPEQAVLYAGSRRFVFVSLGEGRLEPRQVELGRRTTDVVEIVDGLHEGEVVVTSGNFLVAAESRLKLALEQWK
ncbi:MAG: efflux RND transporter periplasmic adaptor subunit, partial [Candidatus Binatia bacterium]